MIRIKNLIALPKKKFSDQPELRRRIHLVTGVGYACAAMATLMFVLRSLLEGFESPTLFLLPAIAVILAILPQYARRTGNTLAVSLTLVSLGFLVIFLRVLQTGGLQSSVASWFAIVPIAAAFMLGIRWSFVFLFIVVASLFAIHFSEVIGLPVIAFESSNYVRIAVMSLSMGLLTMFLWILERERLRNEKAIIQAEKQISRSKKWMAIGQLAGGVAHEINNPLTILRLQSDRLRMIGSEDEAVQKASSRIVRTVDRIAIVIESLVTIVRDSPLDQQERASAKELFIRLENFTQEKSKRFSTEVILNAVEKDISLKGNLHQLSNALESLVGNSYRACENVESAWIRVDHHVSEKELTVSIEDSGKGLDPKVAEKVIDPEFFAGNIGNESGVRLRVSKSILGDYGGRIDFDPTSKNTKFLVTIPIVPR